MTVRVGVIGVGNMGKMHCRVFSELGESQLVAVCDTNEILAKSVAEKYNAKYYTSVRDMISGEDIDAVTVAVQTKYHYDISKEVISYGKPLLIEKPITDSVEDARELIKLAEQKNVKLMIGHIERFNPVIQFLKNLIQQKTFGKTLIISTKRVGPSGGINYGDITIDLAIHDIDIIRFLTGEEIEKVYCDKTKTNKDSGFIDNAFATLKLSNGTLGVIETNWITQKKVRKMTITTEKATIDVDYITQDIEIHKGLEKQPSTLNGFENYLSDYTEGIIEKPIILRKEPLKEELKHFIDCVSKDTLPLVGGEDGLRALKVAFACNESIKREQPVVIK